MSDTWKLSCDFLKPPDKSLSYCWDTEIRKALKDNPQILPQKFKQINQFPVSLKLQPKSKNPFTLLEAVSPLKKFFGALLQE